MEQERDAARAEADALRSALIHVRGHSGYLPGASAKLLMGLLDSIERIADAALRREGK